MKGRKTGKVIPARLSRGSERFERWRANRQERRIPASLWKLAARLAEEFGVNQTSRALRLNYEELKKRVSGSSQEVSESNGVKRVNRFVRVTPASLGIGGAAGSAEYKGADGRWLRVEWNGPTPPDLAGLSERFFFGGGS